MSSQIKLTKNSYRAEKQKLNMLGMYLPTLKLKKALLQAEVQSAIRLAAESTATNEQARDRMYDAFAELFSIPLYTDAVEQCFSVDILEKDVENIAGVEVPLLKRVVLTSPEYSLLDTPIWLDSLLTSVKEYVVSKIYAENAQERLLLLEEELRRVSIRVNLFEKKLIPTTSQTLKKIAIFLSDRSITDVGQMKMAKKKIQQHKE
ncbi:V-type ATP synthase subunit D [Chlamydia trachomatis]|uniref:V-type ATP synthase subunit D n=2 Tax=Chlamydia trachomatis TaxID=813 RepID=UPI0001B5A49B|nr:V-type ATP synthase subunit D [Chlamydia trachomatis]AGT65215.1 ATP synthase subunit D [Chlamydia trachomatis]AGT66141.1 ATP synthase subunit D [Chlamydia trachomatis]AGT67069.1 ATP synthase subunit D [Chlamydia trachomatis F/11-96]AGT68922.1 ATP synthase subunit D [Chlamydia trachomatis]AGT71691.1 ATP synthase subunit D [Chlamydia trachomatis]